MSKTKKTRKRLLPKDFETCSWLKTVKQLVELEFSPAIIYAFLKTGKVIRVIDDNATEEDRKAFLDAQDEWFSIHGKNNLITK